MLEGVLALAGEAAAGARDDQVLLLQRGERLAEVEALLLGGALQRALPEGLARPPPRAAAAAARAAASESRRAASSDWTVLGQRRRLDGVLLDQAVDHLLGEQRVAAGALGHLAARRRRPAVLGVRASAPRPARGSRRAVSGSSEIVVALRRRRPSRAGARAARRGRGRRAAAAPRTQRARCSIRSSIPSSAQWMSSIASTSGRRRADRLDHGAGGREERLAHPLRVVGARSRRSVLGRLDPQRHRRAGRRCARRPRARRAPPSAPPTPRGSFSQAASGESVSSDLELLAQHLDQRPVGDAGAVGRALPAADRRAGRSRSSRFAVSSRSSRDLPTPAWPMTVTRCGRPSRSTRSTSEASSSASSSRPISGVWLRSARRACGPASARGRLPGGDRLLLALEGQRLEPLVGDRLAAGAVGRSADGHAVRAARRPAAARRR